MSNLDRTRIIFLIIVSITVIFIIFMLFNDNYKVIARPTDEPTPVESPTAVPVQPPTDSPTPAPTTLAFPAASPLSAVEPTPTQSRPQRSISVLLDDFAPQPYPDESIYPYNRWGGERGPVNNSVLDWEEGYMTSAIAASSSWGGVGFSLNHPAHEGQPINFSAILPAPILPAYQSQIAGITAVIHQATPGKRFRLELKNSGSLQWSEEVNLDGGPQTVHFDLPALGNVNEFLWVLDDVAAGDFVTMDEVTFTAVTPVTDTAVAAFVWSYGMLLNNWNPDTGLVRDKGHDSSGTFDAIQATGSLAAATAVAAQLGIVEQDTAVQIVNRIGETLLNELPRYHGLWPHFVTVSAAGELSIAPGTEWSSVDTAIAAIGLLTAQEGLNLDTSGTELMLQFIDWNDLIMPGGIGHGYDFDGNRLPHAWDVFGGESWLVELAFAGATGQVAPLTFPEPPTANGSGFIDEMAWLFVPPGGGTDFWGNDWAAYRATAVHIQTTYYPTYKPTACFVRPGLFGLSAAEAPDAASGGYQAYGVGGRFADAVDGSGTGTAVITPHYAALAASLNPLAAATMWDWLITNGYFTPLNNVESLTFPANTGCDPTTAIWNHLKGSWNLALQTLGWGRYLAERAGQTPILWQAAQTNTLLSRGQQLLNQGTSPVTAVPPSPPTVQIYDRECENPANSTAGQLLERENASGNLVHGQLGATAAAPWPEQSGYVIYENIDLPETEHLYLQLHYSKASPSTVPILIYLDNEPSPRAWLYPSDQYGWEQFAWTDSIRLGRVTAGLHTLKFVTEGQQYGVADLDKFILLVPQ